MTTEYLIIENVAKASKFLGIVLTARKEYDL